MERDAARPPPAGPGPQSPPAHHQHAPPAITARKPALRTPSACLLAAGIVVAALVLQSSYGGGAAFARSAAARFNAIIAVGKSAVTRATRSIYRSSGRGGGSATASSATASTATPILAQAAPQEAAPAAPAAPPDQTQLLQTIARDLANLERTIEQLKANQQQMASDNSKAIGELKATQEEMKRALAKVSEPSRQTHSLRHRLPTPPARGLAQARADGRAAASESAASISTEGMDLRRRW